MAQYVIFLKDLKNQLEKKDSQNGKMDKQELLPRIQKQMVIRYMSNSLLITD